MFHKKLIYLFFFFLPFIAGAQSFYTTPEMIFVSRPGEVITDLSFSNKSIEDVQSAINKARAEKPDSIIRITLKGNFTVGNTPLQLSNKMLLMLKKVTFQIAENATATSLISISDAHYISVSALDKCLFDGKNKNIKAIEITNSGKVHIDNLIIKNCNAGGISYLGNGNNVFADAGTISRTTIENCGAIGISLINSFNFACTDNEIKNCKTAIVLNSNYSSITKNNISACAIGIDVSSQYETIAYNTISACDTAIRLSTSSLETFVGNNYVKQNNVGYSINGIKAHIYNNQSDNKIELVGNGSKNQVFANLGILPEEAKNEGCFYFNPPLIGNQHKQLVKLDKGRFDVDIADVELNKVRIILDSVHTQYPKTVLVVHLNGTIDATNNLDSFVVKDDECFLLHGVINGAGVAQKLIYFRDNTTVSFSGGKIDGNNTNGKNGLVFITGNANVIMDSVKVINSAAEGITKRNSRGATYIRACIVDNCKRRGIWQLAADRLFAFDNVVSNCLMDGFDLDAYSTNSVIAKNKASLCKRYGVFVEEGANGHIILANRLSDNTTGVQLFNKEVEKKNTSRNLVAYNLCDYNNRGILLNAGSESKATIDNFIFNNICKDNKDVGMGGFYNNKNTRNNYSASNTIIFNSKGPYYDKADFDVNTVWNILK